MSAAVAVDTAMLTPWYLFAADALRTTDVARLRGWIEDLAEGEAPPGIAAVPVWQQALGGDAAALEREYVRLFLHPAGAPCPPWQSVHGEEPCLMGESHHSALGWYARLGLAPPGPSEAADHAGLLIGFYALLLAEETGEELLGRFAREHLDWLAGFGAALEGESRHPFYRELGRLVTGLAAMAG